MPQNCAVSALMLRLMLEAPFRGRARSKEARPALRQEVGQQLPTSSHTSHWSATIGGIARISCWAS